MTGWYLGVAFTLAAGVTGLVAVVSFWICYLCESLKGMLISAFIFSIASSALLWAHGSLASEWAVFIITVSVLLLALVVFLDELCLEPATSSRSGGAENPAPGGIFCACFPTHSNTNKNPPL